MDNLEIKMDSKKVAEIVGGNGKEEKQKEFIDKLNLNSFADMPYLLDDEKEVALKMLNALDGLTLIRATEVLKFCSKALHYTQFKML